MVDRGGLGNPEIDSVTFVQGEGILAANLTGHTYGTSYPVRIAKAVIK